MKPNLKISITALLLMAFLPSLGQTIFKVLPFVLFNYPIETVLYNQKTNQCIVLAKTEYLVPSHMNCDGMTQKQYIRSRQFDAVLDTIKKYDAVCVLEELSADLYSRIHEECAKSTIKTVIMAQPRDILTLPNVQNEPLIFVFLPKNRQSLADLLTDNGFESYTHDKSLKNYT
jgi:hypothetical protein